MVGEPQQLFALSPGGELCFTNPPCRAPAVPMKDNNKKIQAKAWEKMNSWKQRALIGLNGLVLPMASSPISPLCLILAE